MDKKQKIKIIAGFSALAIAGVAAFWFINSLNNRPDEPKPVAKFTTTESDRVNMSTTAVDYISKIGNYGVKIEPNSPESKKGEILSSLIFNQSNESVLDTLILNKSKAYASTSDVVSENSRMRPTDAKIAKVDNDFALYNYLTVRSEVTDTKAPSQGYYIQYDGTDSLKAADVELDVKTNLSSRTFDSGVSKEAFDFNVENFNASEKNRGVTQKIVLTMVKDKAGWKVYEVKSSEFAEPFANFQGELTMDKLFPSDVGTITYKVDARNDNDHNH